jgi:hypothetical protein
MSCWHANRGSHAKERNQDSKHNPNIKVHQRLSAAIQQNEHLEKHYLKQARRRIAGAYNLWKSAHNLGNVYLKQA